MGTARGNDANLGAGAGASVRVGGHPPRALSLRVGGRASRDVGVATTGANTLARAGIRLVSDSSDGNRCGSARRARSLTRRIPHVDREVLGACTSLACRGVTTTDVTGKKRGERANGRGVGRGARFAGRCRASRWLQRYERERFAGRTLPPRCARCGPRDTTRATTVDIGAASRVGISDMRCLVDDRFGSCRVVHLGLNRGECDEGLRSGKLRLALPSRLLTW